jgi:bifunctional ADP-heptose synthase (sugar kinase/adenylyltransferase)
MLTEDLIERILTSAHQLRIAVVGDLFLDRYLDIDATLTEPSLETGLDAYQVVNVRSQPGAAGTIISNLAAIGVGGIVPVAIVGDDGEGHELRQALKRLPTVDPTHLVSLSERRTPTYTKPMLHVAGHPARELNRLDIKNRMPTPEHARQAMREALDQVWPTIDAMIVLDQVSEADCGVVTADLREQIAMRASRDPARFVLADSRERIRDFRFVCVKPNAREGGDIAAIRKSSGRTVFLTQGEQGILVFPPAAAEPIPVPGYPVSGPVDPVGAGDSVSAGIATAVAAGATHEQAAAFGNLIASITVQQIGTTGTASPAQIRQRWREAAGRS